ncbi:hypothetical protein ACF08W_34615 [Streptomyces sp. NPDC015144]|uniref:hypothetical protein n=1 Tax=Streptomyces sp. NPDC015144 TaxID=3364944 RepID=UPI00370249A9
MSDRSYIQVVTTSTTRGPLDLIAIERAVNDSRPEGMTMAELREAARILIAHGATVSGVAKRLRLSKDRIREWFPAELRPGGTRKGATQCGTPQGYRRHLAKGESCQACRTAATQATYARRRGHTLGTAA